ncbi:MAG: hypothetical protein L0Y79_09190 [Chlorobi bacterium]|nr:hypothetical protein [Chlorobiota bacterium]MCI0716659.1 hypothetical protein [Chlorobiota bacterium]
MKKLGLILIIVSILYSFIGCDSATDSKATSVTRPSLLEPVDNATGVSRYPTFKWSGEADRLEVSRNSNFSNPIGRNISGTQYQLTDTLLDANTVYFWRVGKTSGSTIYWSENSWRFTTGN